MNYALFQISRNRTSTILYKSIFLSVDNSKIKGFARTIYHPILLSLTGGLAICKKIRSKSSVTSDSRYQRELCLSKVNGKAFSSAPKPLRHCSATNIKLYPF